MAPDGLAAELMKPKIALLCLLAFGCSKKDDRSEAAFRTLSSPVSIEVSDATKMKIEAEEFDRRFEQLRGKR